MVLVTRGLGKSYGKNGRKTAALSNLSLEVHPEELYGLVGPDGAGKTTTIQIITNIITPNQKKIFIRDYFISIKF